MFSKYNASNKIIACTNYETDCRDCLDSMLYSIYGILWLNPLTLHTHSPWNNHCSTGTIDYPIWETVVIKEEWRAAWGVYREIVATSLKRLRAPLKGNFHCISFCRTPLRIIVLECARTVPREEVRNNEDKRGKHHTLVKRTTYKQGAKHNHNNGLTYRKQQAATM
jgi:hypothetical protein